MQSCPSARPCALRAQQSYLYLNYCLETAYELHVLLMQFKLTINRACNICLTALLQTNHLLTKGFMIFFQTFFHPPYIQQRNKKHK